MIEPRSIFISHSNDSRGLADLRAVLLARLKNLHDAGRLRVRIDRWEHGGKRFWEDNKNQYIQTCSAAVFLLDQEALNSPYVVSEADNCCHQERLRHGEFGMTIVPVLGPNMIKRDLDNHKRFEVAGLNKFTPIETTGRTIESVVDDILRLIDLDTWLTYAPNPEVEDWIARIEGLLPHEEGDGHFTIRALQALAGAAEPDRALQAIPHHSRRRRLARAVIDATDLGRIIEAIDAIADLPMANALKLAVLVTPLWVPAELAAQLRERATEPMESTRSILLYADEDETGSDFVRRAFRCAREYRQASETRGEAGGARSRYLSTSMSGFSDFPGCLERRILEYCGYREVEGDKRERRLRECLAVLTENRRSPAFVPLSLHQYDRLDLTRYHGLVFLVLQKHGEPIADARLVAMDPNLTNDVETRGRRYARELQALLSC